MEIIINPAESEWAEIIARPMMETKSLNKIVEDVLFNVKSKGDIALKEYTEKFDKVKINDFLTTKEELDECDKLISEDLKSAIDVAIKTISKFHQAQDQPLPRVETIGGISCWQKAVPIEKVGLYIPGGRAPLFSTVLMLALPAKIAGCKEVILCSPCGKDGKIHPAILYAAKKAGVHKIFKVGGSQAIAAMAYGTESIPKVYKIFGPGNQFVTTAKQLVSLKDVAIDMPAGPSEVEVLCDESANPVFVASDLLSQAEHGPDSQAFMVTTSEEFANKVYKETFKQLDELSRKDIASVSISNSKIIVLPNMEQAMKMSNYYAPEHLIISTKNYLELAEKVTNAGSVFLGHLTPESAGDYASGTNHTLPTNGYAKAYSGVNLDSFRKKITFQEIEPEGIKNIAKTVQVMASAESLDAHQRAMRFRAESIKNK